jgi:uncharacterized protein with gpF-like domain
MDDETKYLRVIRPNVGIQMRYQAQLLALIDEMNASVTYWTQAQYRDAPPEVAELAEDASPSQEMAKRFQAIAKKWQARWDKAAPKIADAYIQSTYKATDAALRAALKEAGISVKFTMTKAVRDAYNASIAENVALIKNIPQAYLTQVEGIIARSYQSGFDLKKMAEGIQKETGVSQRRAVNIARDQSNKQHAVIERARRLELGIDEADWIHSGGGKHPRAEHVKAGKERRRFKVADGCPIKNEKGVIEMIQPGEKIFCRCVSRGVIPGLPARTKRPD